MTFVITQNCCTDASCIPICPVDCIRPLPGTGGVTAPMLYIDPATCVDCGACVEACPVDAIYHEDELPAEQVRFKDINQAYFAAHPLTIRPIPSRPKSNVLGGNSLRVAIVGAGPAACYAVTELLRTPGVEINLFERLPTPYGLIRFGVAPDHPRTKEVVNGFQTALAHPNVTCFFNVAVGRELSHEDLLAHHHAVIYAVGASRSRDLGIPGEQLAGNHGAADLVAWYNGHPDHTADEIDLAGPRTVIIGNGNVALDVARILVMDRDRLTTTDIAEHALARLRDSTIEEVVVLGRRGAADAGFTVGELLALGNLDGVDTVIEGDIGSRPDDFERSLKYDIVAEYAAPSPRTGNRRIVLRFGVRPVHLSGDGQVEGLVIADDRGTSTIPTPMVVRSIGCRGTPIAGLPFDDDIGVVPNEGGNVICAGDRLTGVYVTGWVKRGARGIIGTNKACASETVAHLLDDARSGVFATPLSDTASLAALLDSRGATVVDWDGWRCIDAVERRHGGETLRPRLKLTDINALLSAASSSG
jgi:ferredoxin--NADP+ reductase